MVEKNKLSRGRLALVHLGVSALIAALAALLVFKLWYPQPYRALTGGLQLFVILVCVDLVCGPLFTFILGNPKKSRRELTLDLSLVVIIQLAALAYGLYSVKEARPVLLSFELDRMAVVTEAQIDKEDLPNAPTGMQRLPLTGIQKIGIRRANTEQEFFESVNLSMQGIEPSLRPSWWRPFEEVLPEVKQRMVALSKINNDKLDESVRTELEQAAAQTGLARDQLYFLPLTSQHSQNWIVLLNGDADFVGYAEVNGFDLKDKGL